MHTSHLSSAGLHLLAMSMAFTAQAQLPPSNANTVLIHNECPFNVTWRQDSHEVTGAANTINASTIDGLELTGSGQALKFIPANLTAFDAPISVDFSVDETTVYYDVSNVAGQPFAVWAIPAPLQCEVVGCPASELVSCSVTKTCPREGADFEVYLCEIPLADREIQKSLRGGDVV